VTLIGRDFDFQLTQPPGSVALDEAILLDGLDDSIAVSDELFLNYMLPFLEEMSVSGLTDYTAAIGMSDRVAAGDSLVTIINTSLNVTDRVTMADLLVIGDLFGLSDSMTVAFDSAYQEILTLSDATSAGDNLAMNAQGTLSSDDAITQIDGISVGVGVDVQDTIAFSDAGEIWLSRLLAFSDALSLTGIADCRMNAIQTVAEVVATQADSEVAWAINVQESIGITGSFEDRVEYLMRVIDGCEIAATMSDDYVVNLVVSEGVSVSDDMSLKAIYQIMTSDSITVGGMIKIGDEPYQAWVVNTAISYIA